MTYLAVAVLLLLVPPVLFDIVRRPAIRRIGLRNLARRPGEAALVVLGSMLATALIVAAFVVGDSFGSSYRAQAETTLGPIDLLVATGHSDRVVTDLRAVAARPGSVVQSVLAVREADLAVRGASGRTEPRVRVWGVDPAQARAFGEDPEAAGLAGLPERLTATDVALNHPLAARLGVGVGDPVELVLGRSVVRLRVVAVLPEQGVAGYAPVLIGPAAVARALAARPDALSPLVAVSTVGGVRAGAAGTPQAEREVRAVAGADATIQPVKSVLLARADRTTTVTTTRFVTVGGFTVAAAIVLLVNLFVMLAAERTVELGTLRAIGVQRAMTRRAFAVEGLGYGVLATLCGAVVGVALAALVVALAASRLGAQEGLTIRLAVQPGSVASGAAIGLAVAQLTVLLTTLRVVRVDIVAALKNTVPRRSGHTSRRVVSAGLVLAAVAAVALAVAPRAPWPLLTAPVVVAIGLMPLLTSWWGRAGPVLAAVAAMVWATVVFGLFDAVFERVDITIFIVQGLALVGLAVVVVTAANGPLVDRVSALARRSVAARLGLGTAQARPLRTALLTTMYALVIFTMTFTAVLNTVLGLEGPKDIARAGGGYAVVVAGSRLDPVTTADLTARPDVAAAVGWTDRYALVASPTMDRYDVSQGAPPSAGATGPAGRSPGAVRREVTLVPASLADARPPALAERDPTLGTDAQAWAYVAAHPDAVIAPKYVGLEVGGSVDLVDPAGARTRLRVVGLSDWNWLVGAGLYVSDRLPASLLLPEPLPVVRHFVQPAPGVTADQLAGRLNTDYAARGVEAHSVAEEITARNGETTTFITILQSYLALGMLVGIVGLTVALVRGARERRHELGVLRALGFPAAVLRNTLLAETAVVAVEGVLIGVGLGVLTAWRVLIGSTAIARHLSFGVPWAFLGLLAAGALAAALLAALVPATLAGRASPAQTLRRPT